MKNEKYYFEQEIGACKEMCLVKNDGTRIGSINCQKCKYCKDYDKDPHGETTWIICKKIDLAIDYRKLPNDDCNVLDDIMFKEIGQALCYMDYFHPEIFPVDDTGEPIMYGNDEYKFSDGGQRKRITAIIKDFCDNRRDHYHDVEWYKEKIIAIQDETENMV